MPSPIISVENLGKRYRIHHEKQERYTSLRDVIASKAKRLFHPSSFIPHPSSNEDFWALKDVSFEVKPGEVVGIIGRNGAGKSTLLKILSRITEPTEGRVTLRGRVASLLEVGTGFHPELTGRENIFLNGAILGMAQAEIRSKFDEIVAFAEVEKFLDTPVKRYSSGMYVRLAFAVAAHLEPEILIVDEVLAVGDAQFQKKCMGRMQEVSNSGRTILFVSHQMNAIQSLCSQCILLSSGHVEAVGVTPMVIDKYLLANQVSAGRSQTRPIATSGGKLATVTRFDAHGPTPESAVLSGKQCHLFLTIYVHQRIERVRVAIGIDDRGGYRLFTLDTSKYNAAYELQTGQHSIQCSLEMLPLRADDYAVHVYVGSEYEAYDYVNGEFCLRVEGGHFFPGASTDSTHGPFLVSHTWHQDNESLNTVQLSHQVR